MKGTLDIARSAGAVALLCFAIALTAAVCPTIALEPADDAGDDGIDPGASIAEPSASSLTLSQTLDLALEQNPRIIRARLGVEEAQADLETAQAEYHPRIEVQALLAPMTGHHAPAATAPFTSIYSTDLGDLGEWGIWTKISLKLVQPIYTCGKITWLNRARKLGVEVSQGMEAMAAADVRLEVLKGYFGLGLTRRLTDVLVEGREYFDKAHRHLKKMEDADDPSWDPVDQMKVNVYEAQIIEQELDARRMKELAGGQLRRLAGMDPLATVDFLTAEEPVPLVPLVDLDMGTAVHAALDNRPELIALRTGVKAREAEAEARFRKFFPDFVLFAEFEYAYSNVADDMSFPYYDPFNTLGFGAGLAMRFDLNIGAKLGELKKTRAQKSALQAELDGAETAIRLEVDKLFLEMQDAKTMISVRETALKSARGWVIAKSDLFENGMATLQEVIDGLTQFFLAQLSYYQAVYDFNLAVATLERATGIELIPVASLDMAN